MNDCGICCEKFNKLSHKKIECPSCEYMTCRSCTQKYILSTHDNPHCMKCKILWNREFIDSFCTKYFRNTELRRHRENVLFTKEKMLMPQTQPEVERIISIRVLKRNLVAQQAKLLELYDIYQNGHTSEIHPDVTRLYREIENTYRHLETLRSNRIFTSNTIYTRHCPNENCKGFLGVNWYCGLCQKYYCKKCNEILNDEHECDPELVETMTLLNKDSKSCPKCGMMIYKPNGQQGGCDQMWCTSCHTAFSWRTGEIDNGRIHNPHFIEYKRRTMTSREHGDIPCGGMPSFRELREIGAPTEMLQYGIVISDVTHNLFFLDLRLPDNINIRISYMLNECDEDYFKTYLQRQEKYLDKLKDVNDIYELVSNTGGDILRQYVLEPDRIDEFLHILEKLFEYTNEVLSDIRKRYISVTPKNIIV